MKNFISDEEMLKLEKTGQAKAPDFIPDSEADKYFANDKVNIEPEKESSVYNSNPYLKTILGGISDVAPKIAKIPYDTGVGAVKGFLGGTGRTVANAGMDLLNNTLGKIIGAKPQSAELPKEWTTQSNNTQKIGAGIENVAEFALPAGKVAQGGKLLETGLQSTKLPKLLTDILGMAGKSVLEGGSAAGITGLQTGDVNKAITAGALSSMIPPVAGAAKKFGSMLGESVIPLSSKEARLVQSYQAKTPLLERVLGGNKNAPRTAGKTAFDKGIWGTEAGIGVGAKKEANKLWNNFISPQLKKSTVKVDTASFFKEAEQEIIKKNPEFARQNDLLEGLKALENDYRVLVKKGSMHSAPVYGNFKVKEMSMEQLQKFKEGWAKFVPEKAYMGKPIAGAFNEIKDTVADMARKKIYNAFDPKMKQSYLDYGNLKGLQELGIKAMTGGKLKGGFGGFWSAIKDMALTPAGTIGGQIIYKAGQGVELFGKPGARFISDLFQNQ